MKTFQNKSKTETKVHFYYYFGWCVTDSSLFRVLNAERQKSKKKIKSFHCVSGKTNAKAKVYDFWKF